ncbi:hypothetical protein [Streptomyces sp. CC224B]|uniref:F0F1 ATP synthase subunit B family protein n=1 Tax=Streptomyces sp. CC224B TaxID=3044571 RepID=UPI0024A883CA|nr:hypothetical protein [Streptomyces sp. CC224B]
MELLALDLGPLKPRGADLMVALVTFAASFWMVAGVLLPRINRVLADRERLISGREGEAAAIRREADEVRAVCESVLAEGRHEAARIRQRAAEEGVAAIQAARAEGARERDALVAEGTARIAAERAAAEAVLARDAEVLAARLAARVVGEPLGAVTGR